MTIVFKVSDNIKEKMIKFYESKKINKTLPYIIFQVKDFDCVTTLYESGKVMFQGVGADIEASIWIEMERKLNGRIIDISGKEKKSLNNNKSKTLVIKENTIGSDEVGTGDFFGPIVVCASFVKKEDFDFLSNLGVKDSKKLTDKQILTIAPQIINKIPFKAIILDNSTYNNNYSANMNMNKIKAVLHNKVLLSLLKSQKMEFSKIVIDQFTPARNYFGYLTEAKEIVKEITFITKAEDKVLSVACSSIIARYYFLKEMKKLSQLIGKEIPLGAGEAVDQFGCYVAKDKGYEYLYTIAKMNFKNAGKIKELMHYAK